MNAYILFFSHTLQILWYGFIARELGARLGLPTVVWVIGERDRVFAESIGCFDTVVDLLRGFDPTNAESACSSNLAYLSAFEKRCGGVFYHNDVAIDFHISRRRWSDEKIAHYAVHLVKMMERQLETLGGLPLAAFGENNTLPYRLAHRLFGSAIPYWNFTVLRHWDHRFYLDRDESEQWEECRKLYREYREKGVPQPFYQLAKDRLHYLLSHQAQPFYSQHTTRGSDSIRQKLQWHRISRVLNEWRREIRSRESIINPQVQTAWELSPIYKAKQTLTETRRKHYFDKVAHRVLPDGVEYASYFLHVDLEYSVVGLAFEFCDQLALVENIAAFLPAGLRLVVKEHKPMVGVRAITSYGRILRTPNITLLSDVLNSYELIRRSRIVFTLTGTAALEATYEGIPAIIFGDIFFEDFEGVYKVRCVRDLRETISAVLANPSAGASRESAIAALAAMYAASYPGKIGAAYSIEEMLQPENLKLLVDAVEQELRSLLTFTESPVTPVDFGIS